jgi:putative ABC transport system permease protein
VSALVRLYALLLYLYPPSFRREHGREMRQLFHATLARERATVVCRRLAVDLARSLPREWADAARREPVGRDAPPPRSRSGESMRNLLRDLRYGARLLWRSPVFTIAAVATLALGIGANTAMISLANATLLRPVPVSHPEDLFVVPWSSAYLDFRDYQARLDVFSGVAAATGGGSQLAMSIDGPNELTRVAFVSGSLFNVLGVPAAIGRTLQESDETGVGGGINAVLAYDFWNSRFGGDRSVVGRTIRLNARPVTIVGVAVRGFRGISLTSNPRIYLPVTASPRLETGFFAREGLLRNRGFVWLRVIGRLRPGVTPEQASGALGTMYRQLHPVKPGTKPDRLDPLVPLPANALGGGAANVRRFMLLLLGVVGLTLAIGCANLANLLLARGAARRREMGLRLALGGSGGRLVAQMLAESLLLSALGGVAGLYAASATLRILASFQLPGGIPIRDLGLGIDSGALLVTTTIALVTGLLFGIAPALHAARTDALVSLGEGSRATTGRSRLRATLVAAQVALSLVLLAGSGLFLRSLIRGLNAPLGFRVDETATASVNLGLARYDEARARTFFDQALERVRDIPGVTSAAWNYIIPTNGVMTWAVEPEGYQPRPGEDLSVCTNYVGPDYFTTTGTRLVRGRQFAAADRDGSALVVIVNETMARKYWSGREALGGRIARFRHEQSAEIVGVVEDTKVRSLDEAPQPCMYVPFNQGLADIALDPVHLFVRTSGDPEKVLPQIRERLRSLDPGVPIYGVMTFADQVRGLVMPQRMGVVLFSVFSVLALTLATLGIYGVTSYVAALRTREIGIRVALGADRRRIRRFVLAEGVAPVAIGVLAGIVLALWSGRLAARFLFEVSPADPLTYAGVTTLIGAVSLVATYLPARRAARVDPMIALRHE